MNAFTQTIGKLLNLLVVIILATMSCLVFLNVVLRYGFNSSINITEEVSRYMFVWLTFLGAVLAFADNQHVSVGILTNRLSAKKARVLSLATDSLMLFCCYLIVSGSWLQYQLNLTNFAPISGLPQGITYLASVVAGSLIGLLIFIRLAANLRFIAMGEKV